MKANNHLMGSSEQTSCKGWSKTRFPCPQALGNLARQVKWLSGASGARIWAMRTTPPSPSLPSLLGDFPLCSQGSWIGQALVWRESQKAAAPSGTSSSTHTPLSPDNRSWERAVSNPPEALFYALRIIEFQRREQMDFIFLTFSWFQCANS